MNYQAEYDAALAAIRRAGAAVLEQYARFQTIPDAPASVTTEADHEAQDIILEHIHRAFPQDALCAEEATPQLAQAARTGERLWIVDPIDGTRGFARKNGEFSIMVGFVVKGQVALGFVLEPALKRLTYARRGQGCFRVDGDEREPTACHVSANADLARVTLIQSRSQRTGPPSRELVALKPACIVETYSAGIKLARVARGEADIYLNNYPAFHDWDIAAGHILVDEAGGKVTGLGGQELHYGLPGAKQVHGLLASNGLVHDAALRALASAGAGGQ